MEIMDIVVLIVKAGIALIIVVAAFTAAMAGIGFVLGCIGMALSCVYTASEWVSTKVKRAFKSTHH